MKHSNLRGIIILAAASLAAIAPDAGATTHRLRALMDGSQANMGNGTGSPATGVAQVSYDDVSNLLTWDISWTTNLLGTETAMHFHGPAAAGANAGVTQGIGVGSNPAVGSATITPAAGADLLAGLWYVNLHSSVETGGEIRGQVLPADLDDDFSGDLSKWTATTRGLENNAPVGYDPPDITGGQLTLGGTTTNAFWYGNSLESVADFDSRLKTEVKVKRVSLAGTGTAWRSSLWILGDDGHYLHYSQNVGENGWQFNARDDGGTGTLVPTGGGNNIVSLDAFDADGGTFDMAIQLEPRGIGMVDMHLFHDGVEVATHSFSNFPTFFKVILTGQARAANDTVSAVFDDLVVFQEAVENLAPGFVMNPLLKADATINVAYSDTLDGDAIDPEDDPITFSKTAGPDWLAIAENGDLIGTPTAADVGVNEFTIEVSDGIGATGAMLVIRVIDPNAQPSGDLFGWWPLNEGTGSIAADISGNGRDAVIVRGDTGGLAADGSAWIDDPECGPVLSFNGDDATGSYAIMTDGNPDQYGALPLFTNDPDNTFTWSLWVKAEDNQANNDIILGNRFMPGGGDFAPREFIKFDSNNFEYDVNNVIGVDYDDIAGAQLGRWVHHVIVKEGGIFTYYRDGIQAGTGSAAGPQNNQQPLFFGGQGNFDATVTNELWRGSLFDVRLFTNALSADDVFTVFSDKGNFAGATSGLRVIDVLLDGDRNLSFEWTSRPNRTYLIEASTDGISWSELDDSHPSGGDTTTYTHTAGQFPDTATEPRVFLRAAESGG